MRYISLEKHFIDFRQINVINKPFFFFLLCHFGKVFAVDWSPDGEKVASGGRDRVLKLWMG